tara:strand:+ start:262 stop:405 length:144 start_codon:yes stop_codon:yes gene_type:complete
MNITKIILRNDPAKKRRKLGKVKDLYEFVSTTSYLYEFDMYVLGKDK